VVLAPPQSGGQEDARAPSPDGGHSTEPSGPGATAAAAAGGDPLRSGARALVGSGAVTIAAVGALFALAPAGRALAVGCALLALPPLVSLGAALQAAAGGRAVGRPPPSLRRLMVLSLLLVGVAAVLLSAARAIDVAESGRRGAARASASEAAAVGAGALGGASDEARGRLLAAVAPIGGQALLVDALAAPAACAAAPEDAGCVVQRLDARQALVVIAPPPGRAGLLLPVAAKAAAFLAVVLLLGAALGRGLGRAFAEAIADLRGADGAPPRHLPRGLATAIAARVRALAPVHSGRIPLRDDLLPTVASELRAPLDEIDRQAREVEDSAVLNPAQAEGVTLIRDGTRELYALVDAVVDLSAPLGQPLTLNLGPTDLRALAADVARLLRPQLSQRHLSLVIEAEAGLPTIEADPHRVRQILSNLVGNAVKFSREGRITVALNRRDDAVEIAVTDQGSGIAPEALPRLFRPFEQAGDTVVRARGTGLGLAICRRIVDAHGGAITAESGLGVGSTFRVRLPLGRGARPPAGDGEPR